MRTLDSMRPILGSEAVASYALTRGQLRWNYDRLYPNVYLPKGTERTPEIDIYAAWLASKRRGIVAGRTAAHMLLGSTRAPFSFPIELIGKHAAPQPGILIRDERIWGDELVGSSDRILLTGPARTALDLGRFQPRDTAVELLDQMARQWPTLRQQAKKLAKRYLGARGMPAARSALNLMNAGAASRDETRLRLILHDAGMFPTCTDLRLSIGDQSARISMGWEKRRLAVTFDDGDYTRPLYLQNVIEHQEILRQLDWTEIRVLPEHTVRSVIYRTRRALYGLSW